MKNGTPIKEVTIPIGIIAPGMTNLLTADAAESKTAPARADVGKKNL